MNVLFATEYYPPFAPGGSPWSIEQLAQTLAVRGHAVTVVTPNYGAAERETAGGVTIARFPCRRRLPPGATLAPTRDLVSLRFHARMRRAVITEARRSHADVLHAQDKHALVGTWLAARAVRRPAFVTLRDTGLLCPIVTCLLTHDFVPADCSATKLQRECAPFFLDHYVRGGRFRRARVRANLALLYADARLKRAVLRRMDGVLAVSRGLLEIYLRAGYARPESAGVVYTLPPDPEPVSAEEAAAVRARLGLAGRDVVLYLGKLSIGKGGPVFLEAIEQVAKTRPGATFLVVGPDEPPASPSGTDLRWLPRLPHADVHGLYAAVDLVVLPSVGPEALSRIPLEAAAAERPTIGAIAGGIPEEIEHGRTGLLVPRNDAPALARAMVELLADRPGREQLGRDARLVLAKRFDPEAILESLLRVYAEARRRW